MTEMNVRTVIVGKLARRDAVSKLFLFVKPQKFTAVAITIYVRSLYLDAATEE